MPPNTMISVKQRERRAQHLGPLEVFLGLTAGRRGDGALAGEPDGHVTGERSQFFLQFKRPLDLVVLGAAVEAGPRSAPAGRRPAERSSRPSVQ